MSGHAAHVADAPGAACCGGACAPEAPRSTAARARGVLAVVAAVLLAAGCLADLVSATPGWAAPLFLAAVVAGAIFPARRAWESIRRGALDINALMVIAVAGAIVIGEWEEAAMVVFLFAVAQWLESRSLERARAAIRSLLDLAPPEARIHDVSGERMVGLDRVSLGQTMIVRPGERIPLDGTVMDGVSEVNQAPITGESLPVEKASGDEVYAGTINGHGALSVTVTRRREDTTLARIVHLVEGAQKQRAPVQQFIDRFAAWYTPAVVVLALLLAVVPVFVLGLPASTWVYRALVLLVVACPCALVISTPVSMVSALAAAARNGVLIKGGASLERLAGVNRLAFDKTGTLTMGAIRVVTVEPAPGISEDELLRAAAAIESRSEHPIARGIVAAARERDGADPPHPNGVRAIPGMGVEGVVDGRAILCGTPRLFRERGVLTVEAAARVDAFIESGLAPVLVSSDGSIIGLLGLADIERGAARDVVGDLRRNGIDRITMLTGDHEPTARSIGARVGVDDVRAGLLPADKVAAVTALRAGGAVAMVGDGINDAPALAAADVGIVMGAMGSGAAIETADVALMTDDLGKIPYALRLSRAALVNVRANVAIAIGLKAAFVLAAAVGVATLWMAVLADTGASVIVIANALRLRRFA
jgi:Cd2+/Zn2+-exporting ATPase